MIINPDIIANSSVKIIKLRVKGYAELSKENYLLEYNNNC